MTTLSPATRALVQRFTDRPDTTTGQVEALTTVIGDSPALARDVDLAASAGLLLGFKLVDPGTNATAEFDPVAGEIRLPYDLTTTGTTVFALGHETQHALNSITTLSATDRFKTIAKQTATRSRDYTTAIHDLIITSRWDEASATIAGWNALVGYLHESGESLDLDEVIAAGDWMAADFVEDVDGTRTIDGGLTPNDDLSLDLSADNIEAMGRRFFDKPAKDVGLGARGTSDYANYYGAWAVSYAALQHDRSNPGKPMRVDLDRLGLDRKLLEENGLHLGVWQQPYVDGSTHPPTHGILHHTASTYTHIPLAASDTAPEQRAAVAARLAGVGLTGRASAAVRTPSPATCGAVRARRPSSAATAGVGSAPGPRR